MSNRRKLPPPKPGKPKIPAGLFPAWLDDAIRAAARGERVTIDQASIAALLVLDDAVNSNAAFTGPDGEINGDARLDLEFLVPDPADRPGVRKAYKRLLAELPEDVQQRISQGRAVREGPVIRGRIKAIPRSAAAAKIAAHYESRDVYLVAAGPGALAAAMERLGDIPGCACWLDNGTEKILAAAGETVAALPVVLGTLPAPAPIAGVLAIPKTVPAAKLSAALEREIPDDGTQDVILLMPPGKDEVTCPMCLVEAIGRSSPEAAASLIRADRDRQLSGTSPGFRALADQADAATVHGAAIFAAMAERNGGEPAYQVPPPLIKEMVGRFPQYAAAGRVDLCPHLSPSAPEPAFWCAWKPGHIYCGRCIGMLGGDICGTDEDHRCDYCRRRAETIHNEAALLPAIVANLPGVVAASGPITVMFGLCPDCHATAFPEGAAR